MSSSAEDYIKIIYILKNDRESVRSVDIANELGFSRASVSIAMSNLRKKGLVIMKKDGTINFTDEGSKLAQEIYEKHSTLSEFLQIAAGVDEKTAKKDACRIEHGISQSTYDGIREYVKKGRKIHKKD